MARSTPFLLSAGIDFGTAFTKAMIRNTTTEELYAVSFSHCGKEVFFLPSVLYLRDNQLFNPIGYDGPTNEAAISYLKMALTEKCRGTPFQGGGLFWKFNGQRFTYPFEKYIEAMVGCYLRDVVIYTLKFAQSKWPDFGTHSEDRVYFQMSVPAEDAQQEAILDRFRKCLFWAVERAHSGHQDTSLIDIQAAIESHVSRDDCFFLAEVTANVLTYRLSRAGRPGLYLFMDVGAGTVDLSVFLYPEPEFFGEQMNYASARVSFTGSSQIELRALGTNLDQTLLAELRACKEHDARFVVHETRINAAKHSLVEELELAIRVALGEAKTRFIPHQFRNLEVLIGGGGWCSVPYAKAVRNALHAFDLDPELYPLPQPENAIKIWGEDAKTLAPRFSVAHGLSHPFWTWPKERYPREMEALGADTHSPLRINPAHEDDG